jgi:hypothetical protein
VNNEISVYDVVEELRRDGVSHVCILVIVARAFVCTSVKVRRLMPSTQERAGRMTSIVCVYTSMQYE